MKAVLLSLKPEWWEKILAREKDMEIRKTAPQGGAGEPEPWPVLVLVYVSGTGGVQVVEDVKSRATRTREYAVKKKLLKDRFGIDITEV